jgi:hypothetical protein
LADKIIVLLIDSATTPNPSSICPQASTITCDALVYEQAEMSDTVTQARPDSASKDGICEANLVKALDPIVHRVCFIINSFFCLNK